MLLFIVLVIFIIAPMCGSGKENSRDPILNEEVCAKEVSVFCDGNPLSLCWNGRTLYVVCRKTVDFVAVDGEHERHGQMLRDFTFGHVSLSVEKDVEEKEIFLAQTEAGCMFYLHTRATNKEMDYELYKIKDGVKTVVCKGKFSY